MTECEKNIYNVLQDILKNVWEQQKYAEVKNGVILTLNLAVFAIIVRMYFFVTTKINSDIYLKSLFFVLLLLFIINILFVIKSFFPNDKNKEEMKWNSDQINIFFFGDIQKLESNKYLEIVLEKQNTSEDVNKVFFLDISNQIVKLSEITQYKYNSFKNSIYRMNGLGFLYLCYFSYLYFLI